VTNTLAYFAGTSMPARKSFARFANGRDWLSSIGKKTGARCQR
jgi:hypothetical protein